MGDLDILWFVCAVLDSVWFDMVASYCGARTVCLCYGGKLKEKLTFNSSNMCAHNLNVILTYIYDLLKVANHSVGVQLLPFEKCTKMFLLS